jgi:hypothetical protein
MWIYPQLKREEEAQARRIREQTDKLKNEYETKYNEAKTANEARYNEILSGYNTTYNNVNTGYNTLYSDIMREYQGMGDAERSDLRRNYGIQGNRQLAGLQASGLLNTTIAPTVQRQNQDASARAEMLLNERLRRDKLGTMQDLRQSQMGQLTALDQAKYGVMERREDAYPDFNVMLQLAKGLGNV